MSKILNMLMAFVMSLGISGSNVNPSDIPENSNFEVHSHRCRTGKFALASVTAKR